MECRDVRPWLATRRDLSFAQEREVQAHLQQCPTCTTAWTRGERAIHALRALPAPSAQPPQRVAAALEARLGRRDRSR